MRSDVTQSAALLAIVDYLGSALGLNERQCYPVAREEDLPSLPPGGDFFLTVALGDSRFVEGEQTPGNISEESSVTISIYTRIRLDSTGHDRYMLLDDARGLLAIRNRVLAVLVGQDLTDSLGRPFLRQLLFAQSASRPELLEAPNKGGLLGVQRLTFGMHFDVDLIGE